MVFDEEKSWYFDKRSRKPCTEKTQETKQCHKFYGTYFLFSSIYQGKGKGVEGIMSVHFACEQM